MAFASRRDRHGVYGMVYFHVHGHKLDSNTQHCAMSFALARAYFGNTVDKTNGS